MWYPKTNDSDPLGELLEWKGDAHKQYLAEGAKSSASGPLPEGYNKWLSEVAQANERIKEWKNYLDSMLAQVKDQMIAVEKGYQSKKPGTKTAQALANKYAELQQQHVALVWLKKKINLATKDEFGVKKEHLDAQGQQA